MAWTPLSPDGAKSVKANTAPMAANTVYTETNLNKDHFWNIGANEDGHHKFAQMPKYTTGAPATPTSPTLATGMDLAYFARLKTATESVAQQDVQPYARCGTNIMQLLGIRACVLFNVVGVAPVVQYAHNVAAVGGVVRDSNGIFTINFTDALPSNDYIVLGMGQRNSVPARIILTSVLSAPAINVNKTTTFCRVMFVTGSESSIDPMQAGFVFFGG